MSRRHLGALALAVALSITGCSSAGTAQTSDGSPVAQSTPSGPVGPNDGDRLPRIPGWTYTNTPPGVTVIASNLAKQPSAAQVISAGAQRDGADTVRAAVVVGFFPDAAQQLDEMPDGAVAETAALVAAKALGIEAAPQSRTLGKYPASVMDFGGSALVVAYLGNGVVAQIGGTDVGSAVDFAQSFLAVA